MMADPSDPSHPNTPVDQDLSTLQSPYQGPITQAQDSHLSLASQNSQLSQSQKKKGMLQKMTPDPCTGSFYLLKHSTDQSTTMETQMEDLTILGASRFPVHEGSTEGSNSSVSTQNSPEAKQTTSPKPYSCPRTPLSEDERRQAIWDWIEANDDPLPLPDRPRINSGTPAYLEYCGPLRPDSPTLGNPKQPFVTENRQITEAHVLSILHSSSLGSTYSLPGSLQKSRPIWRLEKRQQHSLEGSESTRNAPSHMSSMGPQYLTIDPQSIGSVTMNIPTPTSYEQEQESESWRSLPGSMATLIMGDAAAPSSMTTRPEDMWQPTPGPCYQIPMPMKPSVTGYYKEILNQVHQVLNRVVDTVPVLLWGLTWDELFDTIVYGLRTDSGWRMMEAGMDYGSAS
ncbi:uncharacterized protein EV420DRAFT_1474659 [Desarmillaria tabescens]|uniref:Uncharacterized protein n=1 Tax=Armillaria tabescens TaxID=1929756 RepID=A0AA39TZ88_ARMTA|nr:uncharacterized protein EV420DRAFT_1474659 [Desarmillaria tabescens]KAK0467339.1 hypothetical protein EV420DRAFT_1474659 [Desarmillaria tabescens]